MKTPAHIFVAFAVIVVLFFGYWGVSTVLESTHPTPNTAQHSTSLGDEIPQEWVEGFDSLTTSENITSKLAQNISKDFISRDEEGTLVEAPGSVLGKFDASLIEDPSQLSTYVSAETLGIKSSIDEKKFRSIVEDTSENISSYVEELSVLMGKIWGDAVNPSQLFESVTSAVEKGEGDDLKNTIQHYTATVEGLYSMRVPSKFVSFHKNLLLVLENTVVTLDGIQNVGKDPLRAYVLLDYFSKTIEEFSNLSEEIESITSQGR